MIVAVTGNAVVLVAMKAGMLPLPAAKRPILILLFVHANVVPTVGLTKFTAVVSDPLHMVWFATAFTVGIGFTVIVNVVGVPTQALTPVTDTSSTYILVTSPKPSW